MERVWNKSKLRFWQVSVGDFLKNDWKSHQGGLQMTLCVLFIKNDLVRKYYLENENQSCKIFSSNWELTKNFLLNFSLKLKLFLHNDWKYLANFCSDFFSIKSDTFCFIWGKETGTTLQGTRWQVMYHPHHNLYSAAMSPHRTPSSFL